MNRLADAFIRAVTYLSLRQDSDPKRLHEDVQVLEEVADLLDNATRQEFMALIEASKRAKENELKSPKPDADRLEAYDHWMEMFSEETGPSK